MIQTQGESFGGVKWMARRTNERTNERAGCLSIRRALGVPGGGRDILSDYKLFLLLLGLCTSLFYSCSSARCVAEHEVATQLLDLQHH